MQILARNLVKTLYRMARVNLSLAAALAVGVMAQPALAANWSSTSTISPALQPDPTRDSQLNDVAVNASGLTVAAWDQYKFYAPVSASVGIAIQSGERWASPCTFSCAGIPDQAPDNLTGADIVCAPTTSGFKGFSMTPKVAVGADGTMAVSWTYQDSALLGQKVQVNANAKAVAVNDAGDLVGADLTGAWFYSNGNVAYTDSSTSGTSGTRLFALNNNGVAVGMSYVSGIYQPVTYQFNGVPSPVLSHGYATVDINDAGMITGWFKNGNVEQSFVADAAGNITPIPNLDPAINCRSVRISQANNGNVWVVGNCAGNRPFRYELTSGTLTELTFAGSSNLSVVSVNRQGVTVGTAVKPGAYAPDGYTALVWLNDPASPTDLNANQAFAPASANGIAWNVHATDINEAGTILTGYNDTSGNFYTFLLSPAP